MQNCGKTCWNCGKLKKSCVFKGLSETQPVENFCGNLVKWKYAKRCFSTICTKVKKSQKNAIKICIFHFPFAYHKNSAANIESARAKNKKVLGKAKKGLTEASECDIM